MKNLRKVLPYLAKHKAEVVVGVLSIVLANILVSYVPLIVRQTLNDLEANAATNEGMLVSGGAIVALALIWGFMQFGSRMLIMGASRKVEKAIRDDAFENMLKQSSSFYVKMRTGDIMSRLTNDIEAVRMSLGFGLTFVTQSVTSFVVSVILMSYISVSLTLLSVAPLILMALLAKKLGAQMHKHNKMVQVQLAAISSKAQENFSGAKVVRAFGREADEMARFDVLSREYLRANMRLVKVTAITMTIMTIISEVGMGLVLWYGGTGIISKEFTTGDFMAFSMYFMGMLWPMIALGWIVNLFQRADAAMERVSDVLFAAPEVGEGSGAPSGTALEPTIEFKNLSFAYPGASSSFRMKDVSFRIEKGSTLGIVGTTGSGKTTLVNLLGKLVRAPESSVFVGGRDINTLSGDEVRSAIAFVPQESFLFSDTISSNIRAGKTETVSTEDDMRRAARDARVDSDVESFKNGYSQVVGERGITLSGGQRQRVAIARALLRGAGAVIFDDSLSSVDTHTEEEILANLRKSLSGKTAIFIAHRISTVKNADSIIVMDEGSIIERGTHEELVALKGAYHRMYIQQQLEQQLEDKNDLEEDA